MTNNLRFDGKVAIVTGAGGGLGKAYALLLASRGASVVVNDLGGSMTGEAAAGDRPADIVVAEIVKAGGKAVANYDSVEFGEKIAKTAVDAFGTVDILINNAGILRDISFQKMTEKDWDLIMMVHLKGAFSCTRAVWNIMREKQYGRIINTGSSAGIYGSFGQVNYATAKLGLYGFTSSLAKEGEKRNIKVNCIAPMAGTRMTATVMPPDVIKALSPDYVAPFVSYLAHDSAPCSGKLFEVGAGFIAMHRWQRTQGVQFHPDKLNMEAVRDQWEDVTQWEKGAINPASNMEMTEFVMGNLQKFAAEKEQAKAAVAAPAKAADSGRKSDTYFGMMNHHLVQGNGADIIKKVGGTFSFEITPKKGAKPVAVWDIDLKTMPGHVKLGKPAKADATFTMTDDDYEQLVLGKLNPQTAFMTGKMKIKGNLAKATKFTPDLFPAITPESIAEYKTVAKL